MDNVEAERGASAAVVVNKTEAARAAGCRLPKLSTWLADHPNSAAVIRAGHQGLEWEIDIAQLIAEMQSEKDAQRGAMSKHTASLDSYRLPFSLAGVAPADFGGTSASDALKISRANLQNHKLAKEARLLVPVSEVRMKGTAMFARLAAFLDTLPGLLGRQHGLPDAVLRGMKATIDDRRRMLVRELQTMFERDDDQDEPEISDPLDPTTKDERVFDIRIVHPNSSPSPAVPAPREGALGPLGAPTQAAAPANDQCTAVRSGSPAVAIGALRTFIVDECQGMSQKAAEAAARAHFVGKSVTQTLVRGVYKEFPKKDKKPGPKGPRSQS